MTVITHDKDAAFFTCANEACKRGRLRIKLPTELLSDDGQPRKGFGTDINGGFVSPCGNVFCSRECWAAYCDD